MSAFESGFDPGTPIVAVFEVKFLAKDKESAEDFTVILSNTFNKTLDAVQEVFSDRVQFVEDVELPPAEVRPRDEV